MKKILLPLIHCIILFIFIGCASSVNNLEKNEPISISIQQLNPNNNIIKISSKDKLIIISNFINSIKWTSDTAKPSVPEENGIIIFEYNNSSENNILVQDNPYKVWINEDKSVTIQSFSGKVGTISKEEMSNYELIYEYFE